MKVSWLRFAARPTAHEVVYADRSRREDDEQQRGDCHDTNADRGLEPRRVAARRLDTIFFSLKVLTDTQVFDINH